MIAYLILSPHVNSNVNNAIKGRHKIYITFVIFLLKKKLMLVKFGKKIGRLLLSKSLNSNYSSGYSELTKGIEHSNSLCL